MDNNEPELHELLAVLLKLRQEVVTEGDAIFAGWRSRLERQSFAQSAMNLACYLSLRHHDLRSLQTTLMPFGLSSLGRIEARVLPNLDATIATLGKLCEADPATLPPHPSPELFFEGDRLLEAHTAELFGPEPTPRHARIMVTLSTETAGSYEDIHEILRLGADCLRLNCAHDTAAIWETAIGHARRAQQELGKSCKIFMDLGGPKNRTGSVLRLSDKAEVQIGDRILLTRDATVGELAIPADFQTSCSLPEILDCLAIGTAVWIDDGKIGTTAIAVYPELGVLLQVIHAPPDGVKLRPDKGLNFPETVLQISPLTQKDYRDLDFVAVHADIIGYSFVQRASDIALLQEALVERLGPSAPLPAIVAKIETAEAVRNLPELIVQAAGKQNFGVMIARGDLAVEIGYERLTEIQEEILWLCEAARVPVIWATQVLESLVKKGLPSRGEMTDAAMAERAECVMLNKGPFLQQAIPILDDVLQRMQSHQQKKGRQLRALHSW